MKQCERCYGCGLVPRYYAMGEGEGYKQCPRCEGMGVFAWGEWRPYEQQLRHDEDWCEHMKGEQGSCARCEGA